MSIDAIVLDGFHQGYRIVVPRPLHDIKLYKPKTLTVCDCNPSLTEYFDHDQGICTYKACFRSMDGKSVLYSTSGKSEDFSKGRPWITQANAMMNPRPLFHDATFSCHDDRGWIGPDLPTSNEKE